MHSFLLLSSSHSSTCSWQLRWFVIPDPTALSEQLKWCQDQAETTIETETSSWKDDGIEEMRDIEAVHFAFSMMEENFLLWAGCYSWLLSHFHRKLCRSRICGKMILLFDIDSVLISILTWQTSTSAREHMTNDEWWGSGGWHQTCGGQFARSFLAHC